jgi:hypothetical protein
MIQTIVFQVSNPQPEGKTLYISSALLAGGFLLLLAHALFRRTELMIYTISGNNPIQLPLTPNIVQAAEVFVADVESAIGGTVGQEDR